MEANFSFFKAGQGLFYGGKIRNLKNKKDYSIVYDCGTTNFIKGNSKSLNNEIDNFKIKYSSKKIDLLFISDNLYSITTSSKSFSLCILFNFLNDEITFFLKSFITSLLKFVNLSKFSIIFTKSDTVLIEGTKKAREVAKETMKKVKKAMMLNYFEN